MGPNWVWAANLWQTSFQRKVLWCRLDQYQLNDLNPLYLLYLNVYAVSTQFLLPFSYKKAQKVGVPTTSWEYWKHLFGIPGVRPMFLKAELHKESKNGFKNNQLPALPSNVFFKKLISAPKNWMFCLFLNFYGNIYG